MVSSPAVLILNPLSGFGIHQPTVRCAARERLIDVREVRTGYRAEALARDAVREGVKALVAAGGDGTVSAVAAAAARRRIPAGAGASRPANTIAQGPGWGGHQPC